MRSGKPEKASNKEFFETCKLVFELVAKFSLFAGFTCVSIYLYWDVHMFPSGVTLADSFLFVYVLFGFGSGYGLMTILGTAIALLIWAGSKLLAIVISGIATFIVMIFENPIHAERHGSGLREKLDAWKSSKHPFLLLIVAIALLLTVFLLSPATSTDSVTSLLQSWSVFFGSVLFIGVVTFTFTGAGILYYILSLDTNLMPSETFASAVRRSRKSKEERKREAAVKKRILFSRYGIPILAPLIFGPIFLFGTLIPASMESLGIRRMNATIVLSEENFKLLESGMRAQNMIGIGCPLPEDPTQRIVYGANILWTGIGERS